MTVMKDQMRELKVTAAAVRADRRQVLATQYHRLGNGDLWHLGPRSALIGTRPGKVPTLAKSRYGLYVSAARIRKADASNNMVPALISGRLAGVASGKLLALAWNGRIVGTTRSFNYEDRVQFGVMVPPSVMKRGHNHLGLFVAGPGGKLRKVPRA
jgi:hypothetical protein